MSRPTHRTILITGSSAGIGHEAAAALAAQGARVILHGRTAKRVRAARSRILQRVPSARLEECIGDLAVRAQVDALAADVLARFDRLDVLVHNAAVVPTAHERTAEGIEMQLAVNHLAPFLLTHHLLPLARRSAPARIVVVASQLERDGVIDLARLGREEPYDLSVAYARSKLANVLFTKELARRLDGSGVTANCLHPGIAGTNVLNALIGRPSWASPWTRYQQPKPDVAIAGILKLVSDPALEGVSGAYFWEDRPAEPSAQARDPELARRLWSKSAEMLGLPD